MHVSSKVVIVSLFVVSVTSVIFGSDGMDRQAVQEIRGLVNTVTAGAKTGKISINKKSYDMDSEGCRKALYPDITRELLADSQGRVRRFSKRQRISHDAIDQSEHTYDENGVQRFVFDDNGLSAVQTRVYLDAQGNVFLVAVKDVTGKTTTSNNLDMPAILIPEDTAKAKAAFESSQNGCEEKKRIK